MSQEKESLHTVVETLNQENNNLQIEKDTEVESLLKQVSSLNARAEHTDNQQIDYLQVKLHGHVKCKYRCTCLSHISKSLYTYKGGK